MKKLLHTCLQISCLFLLPAICLPLISCGNGAKATSMHLRRTEGQVTVSDGEGKNLEPRENLGLYSGYGMETRSESYAWIDLDDMKLTKMDQDSEIEIHKDGKDLEIIIQEGSMFFHVTEPLTDDETMTIRTSTMAVGIRGTCGWVEHPENEAFMRVCLLEGNVECTAGDKTASVQAGEMAILTEDGNIIVDKLSAQDVPAFVVEEIENDSNLADTILNAFGIDVTGAAPAVDTDIQPYIAGEILYTETLDFEADGSPELLVIYASDESGAEAEKVRVEIYREGPYGGFTWLWGYTPILLEGETLSLVESNGRLFLEHFFLDTREKNVSFENVVYYGSAAENDGLDSDWDRVEWISHTLHSNDIPDTYDRWRPDERGLIDVGGASGDGPEIITAEEYEAVRGKYNSIQILVYCPDGVNINVTPDS